MAANSLTLSWSLSTGTAPISYQPMMRVTGTTPFLPFGGALSTTSVQITGLLASTSYDLQVIATNPLTSTPSAVVTGATSSANAFPAAGAVSGGQNTGSASPIIRGPQNGTANTGVALAIGGITLTDPTATTGTLTVSCGSGTLAMTGTGVTGSGTASVSLGASFASCQAAATTAVYTAPAVATIDTISIGFIDQDGASHTLLIQIQVLALPVSVAPSVPVVTATAPTINSMQLNWTTSTGTAPIKYQPQFKLHTATTYAPFGLPVSGNTVVITGLSATLSYDFQIVASNAVNSVTSVTVTASTATANASPSAPTNLQVQSTTSGSITYNWVAPTTGSGQILYQPQFRVTAAVTGTRNYYDQPGTNKNVWNIPQNTGATWSLATDADTKDLTRINGFINTLDNFGSTCYVSQNPKDPIQTFNGHEYISNNPVTVTAHVLAGSSSPGPFPGDNQYDFVDNVTTANIGKYWHFGIAIQNLQPGQGPWGTTATTASPGVVPNQAGMEDALSDTFAQDWETGKYNNSTAAGLIRGYDIDPLRNLAYPHIQHRLRYAIDKTILKWNAVNTADFASKQKPDSWPQLYSDWQGAPFNDLYTGNLIYGSTVGIPSATVMPTTLSVPGQMIWWCLQNYGATTRDQASGGIHLCCDQDVPTSWINQAITDLVTITPFLRVMRNQHLGGSSFVTSPIGGPGTPLDVGPPELTSVVLPNPFIPFGSPIAATSVTITGLQPNTSYDLNVIASNLAGSIIDSSGVGWTITTTAQVARAGLTQTGTANVIKLAYFSHQVFHENTSLNWYVWNGTVWNQTTDPTTVVVLPAQPSKPTAARLTPLAPNPTTTTIQLDWTAPLTGSGPYTYELARATFPVSSFPAASLAIATPNFTITGLTTATLYAFNIRAVDKFGTPSNWYTTGAYSTAATNSPVVGETTVGPPVIAVIGTTVKNSIGELFVVAQAADGSLGLTVGGTLDPTVSGLFQIFYANHTVFYSNRLTSWSKVAASEPWVQTVGLGTGPIDPLDLSILGPIPGAVQGLGMAALIGNPGQTSIQLAFSRPAVGLGPLLYVSGFKLHSASTFTNQGNVSFVPDVSGFIQTGLTAGTAYDFQIAAVDFWGQQGPWTATGPWSTATVPPTIPGAPAGSQNYTATFTLAGAVLQIAYVGSTTHADVFYDINKYNATRGVTLGNFVIATFENVITQLNRLFGSIYTISAQITPQNPSGTKANVVITDSAPFGGAHGYNNSDITMSVGSMGDTQANYGFDGMAEMAENYATKLTGLSLATDSYGFGEGLSQCLGHLVYPGSAFSGVSTWLTPVIPGTVTPAPLADYVNTNPHLSTPGIGGLSIGCSINFINWLRFKGYTFAQIFTAINSIPATLPGASGRLVYNKLAVTTTVDPFPLFIADVAVKFPSGTSMSNSIFNATFPGMDLWQTAF
jgi:hypothetical protein